MTYLQCSWLRHISGTLKKHPPFSGIFTIQVAAEIANQRR